MIDSLKNMSNQMTFAQIEQASSGLFPTIVNSLIVIDFKQTLVKHFFTVNLKLFIGFKLPVEFKIYFLEWFFDNKHKFKNLLLF